MGIFPVRIKFTVLLLNRHCLHVSNAKYGQMALQNDPYITINAFQIAKLRENTKLKTETTKKENSH